MKRAILIVLTLCLLAGTAACGGSNRTTQSTAETTAPTAAPAQDTASVQPAAAPDEGSAEETTAGSHILVAYFSLANEQYEVGVIEKGNTEIVAEIIADATDANTFKIESTEEYPTTYDGLLEVSRQEENDPPQIAGTVEDMDGYDTIFLGYPIWWGDLPTIVKVFLQSYDFTGKTIVPFCTHAGSGLSGTPGTIEDICPDASVGEGLAIRGSTAQNDRDSAAQSVESWLADGGYID